MSHRAVTLVFTALCACTAQHLFEDLDASTHDASSDSSKPLDSSIPDSTSLQDTYASDASDASDSSPIKDSYVPDTSDAYTEPDSNCGWLDSSNCDQCRWVDAATVSCGSYTCAYVCPYNCYNTPPQQKPGCLDAPFMGDAAAGELYCCPSKNPGCL